MQVDYKKAKKLCTDAEFTLVEDAKPVRLSKLPVNEVKKKAKQARKTADKPEQRGREKRGLFQEVAQRYEHQLERLEARSGTKPTRKRRPVSEKAAMAAIPAPPRKKHHEDGDHGKIPRPGLAAQARRKGRMSDFLAGASGVANRNIGWASNQMKRSEAVRASRNG